MKSTDLLFELPPVLQLNESVHRFPEGIKTDSYTHTLHRFPGKFVPQVAEELINIVLQNTPDSNLPILDPFCGCGTTNVEAAVQGTASIGVDFDPLAAFISSIKTTPLTQSEIGELRELLEKPISKKSSTKWIPDIENLDHWFSKDCLNQLSFIKENCLKIKSLNARRFSLAVFSAIIRRVSNADDQTQKTYVSGTLKKSPPLPEDLFPLFLKRAIVGITSYSNACLKPPKIYNDDARKLVSIKKIRGIVTSPPYLDSIDYIYNQMLEYFWLYEELGLTGHDAIKALRKEPMGFVRRDINDEISKVGSYSSELGDKIFGYTQLIGKSSQKEAEHVASFFADFLDHILVVKRKLVPGGMYSMVIGESLVRGHQIPTPTLIKEMFQALNFEYFGGCAYEIRRHYMKFPRRDNSGKIKVDYVLCFKL